MAFWGIEVKPGKPFTHKFDDSKGRLHLSMASLGLGNPTTKSVLQCNIGNRSPVFLCCLHPEMTESLQLNLEFEEADEVIFSVIGPRSIHLSGYYLSGGRYHTPNEDSESYGEDIADTDSQRSNHSDEEYDSSFIDDEEPEAFPPSPFSSSREESLDNKKPKKGKGNRRRRLIKKYQVSDSDDDGCSRQKSTANGSPAIIVLESEDEDNMPISSLLKVGTTAKKGMQDGGENADTGIDEGGMPARKSDLLVDKMLPSDVGHRDVGTPKKPKKRSAENKSCESDRDKEDKTQQGKAKIDGNGLDLKATDGQKKKMVNDGELAHENDERPKKKRKEPKNEMKNVDVNNSHPVNDGKENKDGQDELKDASTVQDLSLTSEQNHKSANDQKHSEENKVKKKKIKKRKTQENGEATNMNIPLSPVNKKKTCSSIDMVTKKADCKTSQARTLPNGLVIEELELGKPNGKVATSGKKISIHYVGKLKTNGEFVDSNTGSDPYKFRLGAGLVMEGWDIGLQGMRVGAKRRLIVPPSMGYGRQGKGEKIPPNSWLVYEVELVKVR